MLICCIEPFRCCANAICAAICSFVRSSSVPIRFFDTQPLGRILNRFSKDIGFMDDLLPLTFFDFANCLLLVLGSVTLVCIVNPWVLLATLPLTVVFFKLRAYYLLTARDVKRLEAVSRSPVLSLFTETLRGMVPCTTGTHIHRAGWCCAKAPSHSAPHSGPTHLLWLSPPPPPLWLTCYVGHAIDDCIQISPPFAGTICSPC